MAALDPRAVELRRMKAIALALLVAMLAGFALSHAMGAQGPWAWVRAFCEAATVGALADWFAVVALFRHPLGLPFPHTAIIPNNKDRIADNLAAFVRDHFLDPPALLEKLRVFDPAARLGRWLGEAEQARAAAGMARVWALRAIELFDDATVQKVVQGFARERLQRWDASRTLADVLGLLTRDGRHQALLDQGLRQVAGYLAGEDVRRRASGMMVGYARREWPRILGAVERVKSVEGMGDRLADRLAQALLDELQQVLSDPAHPLRRDYEAWLGQYLARLGEDETLAAEVERIKNRLIDDPAVQTYLADIWHDVREALRRGLAREDSALARHAEEMLAGLARRLRDDAGLREALNEHLLGAAASLAERLRHGITTHIAQTVRAWDERQLVEELELSVGRDLQYIRFNGTLVGGCIGVLLHAVVVAFA